MQNPLHYEDVLAAAERIKPFLTATPLRNYPALDQSLGCKVLIKHENHQPTGAFKIRNALSAMTRLDADQRRAGVVAATRGNHGLGLAYAGHLLDIPVTICVPQDNSATKNEAIESWGAALIRVGDDFSEAIEFSKEYAERHHCSLIHAIDNVDVLAGAATITLEALAQSRQLDQPIGSIYLAVGGGSQAVGALTVLKAQQLSIPVFGVQAAQAATIHDSFHAGKPVVSSLSDTIADGIATNCTFEYTFDTLREGLQDMYQVTEAEIADAVRLIISKTHNLVEGAAAVGLAGMRQTPASCRPDAVLVVLSGGNIDWPVLRKIVNIE
ncbi:MAG: threonine/serine dehydratase [Novipirellula sp. JB048]